MNEPIYHIRDVAERCGVPPETVHDWLERGLRHLPLGDSIAYRPRDVLVRESWLTSFLESTSVVRPRRSSASAVPEKPVRPARRPATTKARSGNILGPCPA